MKKIFFIVLVFAFILSCEIINDVKKKDGKVFYKFDDVDTETKSVIMSGIEAIEINTGIEFVKIKDDKIIMTNKATWSKDNSTGE